MMSNDYGGAYYGNANMDYDDESSQETQQTQQATQVATQPSESQNYAANASFWGYLQPNNEHLARLDLFKIRPSYTIGRHPSNAIVLPGFKVSNKHCEIEWDGIEHRGGTVLVRDFSSNGTFINGRKIGRGQTSIIRDGNELAFGSPAPQPGSPLEDYRFVYRHMAAGVPTTGFYAFYDLGPELGKGSFATVYKAMNHSSGIWYAVKMIKDKSKRGTQDGGGGAGTPLKNTSIAREIGIMEALKHPNICQLFEVFMEEDSPDINLVMEYVDGGDLLEYILNRNGLNEDEARHITYQICNALSYVHGVGITHRDLKPENILLTKDDPPVVKIADFGLAKIVDSMTMLRTMCGTPSYLAPEVVKQEHHEGYTSLVDSWSVGVIVFSMLTNSSPFIEDEGQQNLRIRIIERVIDWDTLSNRGVTEDAFKFVQRLMDEDPSQRMSLADALDHPWLASYVPEHPVPRADAASSQNSSQNSSQGSGATRYLDHLGLNSLSEARPLQRRSDIMNQAAEGSRAVPQPPPEMIAHSNALDEEEEELSQRLSQSQGQNQANTYQAATRGKRVRANLTPLDEDSEDEEEDIFDTSTSGGAGSRSANGSGGQATRSKRPRLRAEV